MIFGIFRISGHSMMPTLKPGDRIIVSSFPYFITKPKKGDVILLEENDKMLLKRISEISNGRVTAEGDNKGDSLKIEPFGMNKIKGKFICKI